MPRFRFGMMLVATFAAIFGLTTTATAAPPIPVAPEVASIDKGSAGADQTMMAPRATTYFKLINITFHGAEAVPLLLKVDRHAVHFAPAPATMLGSIDNSATSPTFTAAAYNADNPIVG